MNKKTSKGYEILYRLIQFVLISALLYGVFDKHIADKEVALMIGVAIASFMVKQMQIHSDLNKILEKLEEIKKEKI